MIDNEIIRLLENVIFEVKEEILNAEEVLDKYNQMNEINN